MAVTAVNVELALTIPAEREEAVDTVVMAVMAETLIIINGEVEEAVEEMSGGSQW